MWVWEVCEGITWSVDLLGETPTLLMAHPSLRDPDCILSAGVRLFNHFLSLSPRAGLQLFARLSSGLCQARTRTGLPVHSHDESVVIPFGHVNNSLCMLIIIIISRLYSLTIVAVLLLRSDFSNPYSLLARSGCLRKQTTIRHAAAWKGIDWFRTWGRRIRSSRLSICAISPWIYTLAMGIPKTIYH